MTPWYRRSSASALAAALLVGASVGALAWGVVRLVDGSERATRRSDVRATLARVHTLLDARAARSASAASALASSAVVQDSFLAQEAGSLDTLAARRPDVGFVLWNGRVLGHRAVPGVDATVGVYSGGQRLGLVVVSASPTQTTLAKARTGHSRVALWFAVGSSVVVTSPAVARPDLRAEVNDSVGDELALNASTTAPARVYAFRTMPHVPAGWLWPWLLGVLAAAISYAVFRRVESAQRSEPPSSSVRDAVSLVGETLAATHNPDALLPVILQAAIEATGASGGEISRGDVVLATRGSAGDGEPLVFPLNVADGRDSSLTLHPPAGGFQDEARDAAAWIAAQALIALENAHLHGLVQRQAVTDELTGLANRRRFLSQLDGEIARSRRNGSPLAIVLGDLDDFKRVNDEHGHDAGDRALRVFANILREAVRDVDLPVRLGGEEFALLLPDTDLAGAANLAERIRATLASTAMTSGGRSFRLTASFGISCFPAAAAAEELLLDADRRLYDAKRRGKNRVEVSVANHAEFR